VVLKPICPGVDLKLVALARAVRLVPLEGKLAPEAGPTTGLELVCSGGGLGSVSLAGVLELVSLGGTLALEAGPGAGLMQRHCLLESVEACNDHLLPRGRRWLQ
jgi:hypothetical protein